MSSQPVSSSRYAPLLRHLERSMAAREVNGLGLILVRLDGLARINGEFGYACGDLVIEEIGRRLQAIARRHDAVLPLPGLGYAFVICNPLHSGHAVLAAERVARESEEAIGIAAGRVRVRLHIGVSLWPAVAADADDLLRQCEAALALARHRDEDYVVFDGDQTIRHAGLQGSLFDVDEAIEAGEFELHYQPKLRMRDGRLYGAEALIRWHSPEAGLVSPAAFLPAIEQTRGIRTLFNFVLNAALREAGDWCRQQSDFYIAVNASPGNLEDPDLADMVADSLAVWNFPAEQLILEITETALMHDPVASSAMLQRLHDLGIRLAIDDFGTGYSSLTYLRSVPAHELKIDRSFVNPMLTSQSDREIVGAVIRLGHALNMDVVAEGIEDADVMQALKAMGCDIGQGYYLGMPSTAESFQKSWLSGLQADPVAG